MAGLEEDRVMPAGQGAELAAPRHEERRDEAAVAVRGNEGVVVGRGEEGVRVRQRFAQDLERR